MTPAQAHALIANDEPKAPRREKNASREGWTKIRNREELMAAIGMTEPTS